MNRIPLTIKAVFITVTATALIGMLLGGLFGLAAGSLAPGLFSNILYGVSTEPVGAALVLGAIAGILLGGSLGVFAIIIQVAGQFLAQREPDRKKTEP
jgi:hypothetical protein